MSPKLYTELTEWWPLLSPSEEYLDEVSFFRQVLVASGLPPAPTLLEMGCGSGNVAVYLKDQYRRDIFVARRPPGL